MTTTSKGVEDEEFVPLRITAGLLFTLSLKSESYEED
jgi:hypothetical protein